ARYGGEEFALVLSETDPEGARAMARHVLGSVAELAIEHSASSCAAHVTVSLGIVSLIPAEGDSSAQALEKADRLLYEAKGSGRHRGVHLDVALGAEQRIAPPDHSGAGPA
ncbi:MAG TPA: GGDEF domain-containing protein, partial [Thermoanaerobaculia bacterium]|nr:GGDEF domain-containing protein [Thermoanaerobaculia bacterium]